MPDDGYSVVSMLKAPWPSPRRYSIRLAIILTGALYVMGWMPVLLLSIALFRVAVTIESKMVCMAMFCLFAGTVSLWACWAFRGWRKRWVFIVAGLMCLSGMVLVIGAYLRTPDGHVPEGAEVRSVFLHKARYARGSFANLVPEIDQLKLETHLLGRTDRFIDAAKARRIRRLFLNLHREIRQSKEFRSIGSALNYAYRDLLFGSRVRGHCFEFVPSGLGDEQVPVIIFLHGSFGNLKAYFWLWSRFGRTNRIAVLLPSFGAGNWDCDQAVSWILELVAYCKSDPNLDENHIYLAGISNGAKGVSRAAAATPDAYAGLVYISPAFGNEVLANAGFAEKWGRKPVLILHGIDDQRVPASIVERRVSDMTDAGLRADSFIYEDEDHFLFFSDPETVLEDIEDWIRVVLNSK